MGEEDGGLPLLNALPQFLLGEGGAASGGGGEEEVLRHPLEGQHHPVPAEALLGLPQPLDQSAPGQGGGDAHLGVGGAVPVLLRDQEGPAAAEALVSQLLHHLLQGREAAGLKVTHHPGEAPSHALPQNLLAEGRGGAQAVKAPAVQKHKSAPGGGASADPKQMGPLSHAVGHVDRRHREVLHFPEAVG